MIVGDNSRDDGTRTAVRGHPALAGLLWPAANTGALGRNLAVRHARTPYVAFSDDSWWEPDSLAGAADLLDRHSRLGLLAARTLVGDKAADDPLNAVLAGSPLPPEPDLPGHPVLGLAECAATCCDRAGGSPTPGTSPSTTSLPAARRHGSACPRDPQHPVVSPGCAAHCCRRCAAPAI
ncbi:glycosyltransferase family 2 protein [Streptomyces sp. NPDC002076]